MIELALRKRGFVKHLKSLWILWLVRASKNGKQSGKFLQLSDGTDWRTDDGSVLWLQEFPRPRTTVSNELKELCSGTQRSRSERKKQGHCTQILQWHSIKGQQWGWRERKGIVLFEREEQGIRMKPSRKMIGIWQIEQCNWRRTKKRREWVQWAHVKNGTAVALHVACLSQIDKK